MDIGKPPELYDIWKEDEPRIPELPWRMQLVNYVAQYPTQAKAEQHRDAIQKEVAAKARVPAGSRKKK